MADLIKKTDTLNEGRVKINKAIESVDTFQRQLDEIVVEGDSSVEAAQARVDKDGKTYSTLKERLDTEHTELNTRIDENYSDVIQQLEHKVDEADYNQDKLKVALRTNSKNNESVVINKKLSPTLTIIDDDTRSQLYTLLYPAVLNHNIPITSALISSRIGVHPNTITYEQFKEMKESGLVEFVNHTRDHVNLSELATEEEIEEQIRDCQIWLRNEGIYTSHIVYPWGGVDERVFNVASKYVQSGSRSNTEINNPFRTILNSYLVNRVDFSRPWSVIKDLIDSAVENNSWIVISTHAHYPHPDETEGNLNFDIEKFNQMIDYAKSLNMSIKNYSDAYDDFKNVLELRREGELITAISAAGLQYDLGQLNISPADIEPHANWKPSDFPHGVTVRRINNALQSAGEWPSTGTLTNYNIGSGGNYDYQILQEYRSPRFYVRYWESNNDAWGEFEVFSGIDEYSRTVGPYSISAGGVQNLTISSDILKVGKAGIATPQFNLPNGLVYSFAIRGEGDGILRIYNISSSTIELPAETWVFKAM